MKRLLLILLLFATASFAYNVDLFYPGSTIYSYPQHIFYDANGSLNLLYFSANGGVDYLTDAVIINGAIASSQTIVMPPSNISAAASIMYWGNTTILRFYNDSRMVFLTINNMSIWAPGTYLWNLPTNLNTSNFDLNSQMDLESVTPVPSSSAFFPFSARNTSGKRQIEAYYLNQSVQVLVSANSNEYADTGSTPTDSTLTDWYIWRISTIPYVVKTSAPTTSLLNVTGNRANMNGLNLGFRRYGNTIYAYDFNDTVSGPIHIDAIYRVSDWLNYTFGDQLFDTSPFFFIDEQTFVFFAYNVDDSQYVAYSCYFNVTSDCLKFNASDYGFTGPLGPMLASKRNGTYNVVALGSINASNMSFTYNETAFDARISNYNEVSNAQQIFSFESISDTSYFSMPVLVYGYAAPSSFFGSGIKRIYTTGYNGTKRLFLLGLNNTYVLNSYSLNLTTGAYYSFTVKDAYGQLVPNVTISAYRFNPPLNMQVIVEQGITDFTGSATLYLQPTVLYTLVVTANGYATINTFFVPGVTGNPLIQLGSTGAQTIQMPDWAYEVNDISWTVTPTNASVFNATNVTFQISAAHADLQYFGLIVSRMNYSNLTQICSQNISASPGGGILYCNINATGNYQIQPFWRVQGYQQRLPFARTLLYSNGTSWNNALQVFQQNQPIGPWGFYAIGLIIAMIAGGWVSKYSIDGAGLAVCAVLWFFTFFNPNSCLANLTSGLCITPMIVTTFTTVVTVGALYLVKYL